MTETAASLSHRLMTSCVVMPSAGASRVTHLSVTTRVTQVR